MGKCRRSVATNCLVGPDDAIQGRNTHGNAWNRDRCRSSVPRRLAFYLGEVNALHPEPVMLS
jgi:hypothetical protein